MLINDKLDEGQRLRLECLAQAVTVAITGGNTKTDYVLKVSEAFEDYVRNGKAVQEPKVNINVNSRKAN